MRISLHLSENQNEVQKQIENCADILFRPLLIGEKEKTEAFLIYIEVAVSNLMLEDSVIGKLLNRLLSMDTKEIYGTLENNSLGISDTKELVFDPAHARFVIHTPYCGYFSGSPAESLQLSEKIERSRSEAKAIREAVSRKRIQKKVCEAQKKHFLSL